MSDIDKAIERGVARGAFAGDPGDAQGRSYLEVNASRQHTIPIGALVEIKHDEDEPDSGGVRLFVVFHSRDCDQTPLYELSADSSNTTKEREGFRNRGWWGGYSENSLTVIRLPNAVENLSVGESLKGEGR